MLDAVGFELGRLLFFACCASLDPALTTRADRWLCLDISAPLNTQIECVLFLCACGQDEHKRPCIFEGTLGRPSNPKSRGLAAYHHLLRVPTLLLLDSLLMSSPAPHRAGLRVRDDLRLTWAQKPKDSVF